MASSEPEYVVENRALWTQSNVAYADETARKSWSREAITWGIFGIPEKELGAEWAQTWPAEEIWVARKTT